MNPRGSEQSFEAFVGLPSLEWTGFPVEPLKYFYTKEEAIKWAQEKFGADEEGRICLVSTF